jgi:hypothetical protein
MIAGMIAPVCPDITKTATMPIEETSPSQSPKIASSRVAGSKFIALRITTCAKTESETGAATNEDDCPNDIRRHFFPLTHLAHRIRFPIGQP